MGNTKILELFSSVLEAIQLRRRRRRNSSGGEAGGDVPATKSGGRGGGVQNSQKLNYVVLVRSLRGALIN